MSSNTPVSELEVTVITIGGMLVFAWGTYSVYRKMISRQKGKPLSWLVGLVAGCALTFCWICFGVIAVSPDHWVRLSPVAAVLALIFYAAWRYTRVEHQVEGMSPSMWRQAWTWSVQRQRESNQKNREILRDLWQKLKQPKPVANPSPTGSLTLLPAVYEFDYAKEDGEITSRRVYVQSTSYSGGRQYLEGICKTRNARRTFRVDRVIGSMTRVDDGQMLRASELFAHSTPSPITPMPSSSPARKREWETAVFFAGFGAAKRSELEELAEAAGWQVRSSITKTVDYVVTGSMVGSSQLAKAGELGIAVLDEEGFRGRV